MGERPRIVRRPDFRSTGGRAQVYPIDALVKTLGTNKAVRVPFGAKRPGSVISALSKAATRRRLKLRYRQDRHGITAWVERRQEKSA